MNTTFQKETKDEDTVNAFNCSNVELVRNTEWQTVELNGEEVEIPSDWKSKPLSYVAKISKGKQVDFPLTKENNKHINYPYINGGKNPSGYSKKRNTKANTIAISEGGASAGFIQFVDKEWWCGGHCYAIDAINEDNRALYWILKYNENFIMDKKEGTGLPNLKLGSLARIELKIPPLSQQTLIAKLLTAQEEHIESLRARASIERNKLAFLSDELLSGRIRVSVDESGPEIVVDRDENGNVLETLPSVKIEANTEWQTVELDGEEVEIPLGWDLTTPKNMSINISTGKLNANAAVKNGSYPFFTCSANEVLSIDTYSFDTDAILISGNGSTLGEVRRYSGKFDAYQRTYVLDKILNIDYIHCFFKKYFKNSLNIVGGSVPFIKIGDIENFAILLPSNQEQKLISKILNIQEDRVRDLDIIFTLEEKKLHWLSDELLSGRLLVKKNNSCDIHSICEELSKLALDAVLNINKNKATESLKNFFSSLDSLPGIINKNNKNTDKVYESGEKNDMNLAILRAYNTLMTTKHYDCPVFLGNEAYWVGDQSSPKKVIPTLHEILRQISYGIPDEIKDSEKEREERFLKYINTHSKEGKLSCSLLEIYMDEATHGLKERDIRKSLMGAGYNYNARNAWVVRQLIIDFFPLFVSEDIKGKRV